MCTHFSATVHSQTPFSNFPVPAFSTAVRIYLLIELGDHWTQFHCNDWTGNMFSRLAVRLRTFAPARSATMVIAPEDVLRRTARRLASMSGNVGKKGEDVMPIATGHERQELEAELQGKNLLEINYPFGPFGTKGEPAVIKSYFDKRIVGCPGGEGEDEHDVVWFWLEKGKPHECPVCSQYFVLEVVGPGGPPDGHGDSEDDNH